MSQGLTESNREALAIRWRRILTLGLIDFFNGINDFGKYIIKELVDMREAMIRAFAKSLGYLYILEIGREGLMIF